MHHSKLIAAVTVCLFGSVSEGIAGGAKAGGSNASGAFIASSPGLSVEYLIVNALGKRTTGDLEAIAVSKSAPDGEVRTRTLSKSDGDTLIFGSRVARPSSGGYLVTSIAGDGFIRERRFVRTSIGAINAAVVALTFSVNRKRVASDRLTTAAQLRTYGANSAEDARRLTKAELAIESATATLNVAQSNADRLAAIARQTWAGASAEIDESGVSLEQNRSRNAAMKLAATADENADAAQRQADVAGQALADAKLDVKQVRAHIAMILQRTHALATQGTSDDSVGR